MLRPELKALISDMQSHERHPDPALDQTIGWYAYRRAEKWNSVSDFDPLLSYLGQPGAEKKDREMALIVLVSLVSNVAELSISPVIALLDKEKNEDCVRSILWRIQHNKIVIDQEQDVELLLSIGRSDDYYLRSEVWGIMRYCKVSQPKVEARLIEVLENFTDVHEPTEAAVALQSIGSPKSLPTLKKLMDTYRNKEFLTVVIKAIKDIGGKEVAAYLVTQLEHQTNGFLKKSIAECLTEIDDPIATVSLIGRIKKILAKPRNLNWHYASGQLSELVKILLFLQRHIATDKTLITDLFVWIKTKKMDLLKEDELKWVKENL